MAQVTLNVEHCIHEDFKGEYRSGVWEDSNVLSFFSSNLDNSNPVGFGEDPDEEAMYEYYFNIYADESDKKVGEVYYGSGTIFVSTDGSTTKFQVYLSPKGLRWEIEDNDEDELREGYSYESLEELDDDDLTDLIYQYNVIDTSDDMPKDPKELLKDLWDNIDVDKIVPRRGVEYQQLTDLSNEDLIKMKAYLGLDTEKDLELMEHITEIWDWLYVVRNEDPIPYDYDRDSFLFDTYDDIHVGITYDNLKLLSHIEQWELGLAYYDGHDAFTPRLEDGKFKVEELWYFLKGYTNGDKLDYIPDLNCYLKDLVRCETEDDFKGWMEDAGMYGDEVTKYNIGTVWLAAREIDDHDDDKIKVTDKRIAYQLSKLSQIKAPNDEILEVKIVVGSGVNQELQVSDEDISLDCKMLWDRGSFIIKLPITELKELLSKKPFSELGSDELLHFDGELYETMDGNLEWTSINGESDLKEILKGLKDTQYEYEEGSEQNEEDHIDEIAQDIYSKGDIIDSEYIFHHLFSLEIQNYSFSIDWHYWEGLLNQAKEKRKEGAFAESNTLLEEVIGREDKKNAMVEAYQLMGENYLSLEAYDKVIEPLNKAIELGKEEYMVYSDLGRSYFALKNYDEAINAFKNASRLNDGAFYPDWMLARIFKEKDQNKEALEHINIAIERDKLSENSKAADYQLYNIRGDINIDLGNYQKAIEDFEQALDLSPNSAFLNYRLGQLYYETKNYEAGYKNFQKAQSLDERMQSDGNVLLLKGHCLYRLKKTAKALEEYDKASALGNEEAMKWKEFIMKNYGSK